jgi:hypothetical protein
MNQNQIIRLIMEIFVKQGRQDMWHNPESSIEATIVASIHEATKLSLVGSDDEMMVGYRFVDAIFADMQQHAREGMVPISEIVLILHGQNIVHPPMIEILEKTAKKVSRQICPHVVGRIHESSSSGRESETADEQLRFAAGLAAVILDAVGPLVEDKK